MESSNGAGPKQTVQWDKHQERTPNGQVQWENCRDKFQLETSTGRTPKERIQWEAFSGKNPVGNFQWGMSNGEIQMGQISEGTCLRENSNGEVPKEYPKYPKAEFQREKTQRDNSGQFQRANSHGRTPKGKFEWDNSQGTLAIG